MRESWTDGRLDDLNGRVTDGFRRVDEEIASLRGEVGGLRAEMNARFDSLQRTMLQFCGAMIVSVVGLFAALLGLVAVQL